MTQSESTPPHSEKIESSVLSCCIQDKALFFSLKSQGVTGDYFYNHICNTLFAALERTCDSEDPFDLILLAHECQKIIKKNEEEELNDGFIASEVTRIFSQAGMKHSFDKYVKELKELYWQRRSFIFAHEILTGKKERNSEEFEQEFTVLAGEIQKSRTSGTKKTSKGAKDLVKSFVSEFRDKYNNKTLPGISTGVSQIDDVTGGMRHNQFWILGGPTSSGKSALALQFGLSALKQDKKVGIVSLEMSGEEVIGRMLSASEGIHYDIIYNPQKYKLTKDQILQIKHGNERFLNFKLEVNDEGQVKMEDIEGVVADMERDGELDLIIIDHMHLLSADHSENKRHLELSKISGLGKALAMKKKVPVVMPCQLNEDGKIRDSRAIADDADVILMIRHDHIWVEKNRNGVRYIELPLQLVGSRMTFMTPLEPR